MYLVKIVNLQQIHLKMINMLQIKKCRLTENHIIKEIRLQDKKQLLHGIGEGK